VFKFDHDLVTGLIKVDIILSHYLGRHSTEREVFKFDHDLVTGLIKVDIILSHYLGRHSIKMKCSSLIMILSQG